METIPSLEARVREYFQVNNVTEVKTPCLSFYTTSEPNIKSFSVFKSSDHLYLRTSPESALKQIVCKSEIDIFEIGPVFRDDEIGVNHLSEFTMLEWYRVDMTYEDLMDDVVMLLNHIGLRTAVRKFTYNELFEETFGFNCHTASSSQLEVCSKRHGLVCSEQDSLGKPYFLEFLTSHMTSTKLRGRGFIFVYNYPKELRCYSELSSDPKRFAKRFELFCDGLELANGYQEILGEEEQRQCFDDENKIRIQNGLPKVLLDEDWLYSLRNSNLKVLAGVALGLERVLMKMNGIADIGSLPSLALKDKL